MQIHELSTFSGTPSSTDYLAIDNSTTTTKIGATGLGVQTEMTKAEATTGTSTGKRVITPKVLHDYFMNVSSASSSWNGCTILYEKYGRVVTIKVSGSTTNQTTSTNGGELAIDSIPTAYKPKNLYLERKYITGTIQAQVQATTGGDLKLGYSANISGSSSSGANIPASSAVRIEICYISAS